MRKKERVGGGVMSTVHEEMGHSVLCGHSVKREDRSLNHTLGHFAGF